MTQPLPSSPSAIRLAPPRWMWALAAAIAAARSLPWLATFVLPVPEQQTLLHTGYIPKDFLQYAAFVRAAGEAGGGIASWLLADPFTTDPQQGRFVLPLFSALGIAAHPLGIAPTTALELARIPLVFAFFATSWWFLAPFTAGRREREHALLLVGLAGGIEVLALPLRAWLPPELALELEQATWQMNGWSSFAVLANPLWTAGACGLMAWLRPLLCVPQTNAARPAALAGLALGGLGLFVLHPYSAVGAFTVAAAVPLLSVTVGARPSRAGLVRSGVALGGAALGIAAFAAWQRADPVHAEVARGALGTQQLSPFWYPLVFGALGVLALRGACSRLAQPRRHDPALLGWLAAGVWLHTSTLLNGYHFAQLLHVPLCILAAPALGAACARARARRAGAIALIALAFATPLLASVDAIARIGREAAVPQEFPALAAALAPLPPGNVLCGARLGNFLPAATPHRVHVGHHFLTPHFRERARRVSEWSRDARHAPALVALAREARIDYVVLPTAAAAPGLAALAPLARDERRIGRYTLLVLADGAQPR